MPNPALEEEATANTRVVVQRGGDRRDGLKGFSVAQGMLPHLQDASKSHSRTRRPTDPEKHIQTIEVGADEARVTGLMGRPIAQIPTQPKAAARAIILCVRRNAARSLSRAAFLRTHRMMARAAAAGWLVMWSMGRLRCPVTG